MTPDEKFLRIVIDTRTDKPLDCPDCGSPLMGENIDLTEDYQTMDLVCFNDCGYMGVGLWPREEW